ncbi:hypothetical protein F5Y19DRAFT_491137 [Xylariaceae sp. FL1651]|nr:hypothetical protein F5Y19DRAFT_491137 [Xylariaceae sp. FL1651]
MESFLPKVGPKIEDRVEIGTFKFRLPKNSLPRDIVPKKDYYYAIEWRERDKTQRESCTCRGLRLIGLKGTMHGEITAVAGYKIMEIAEALGYQNFSLDGQVVEVSPIPPLFPHGNIRVGITPKAIKSDGQAPDTNKKLEQGKDHIKPA